MSDSLSVRLSSVRERTTSSGLTLFTCSPTELTTKESGRKGGEGGRECTRAFLEQLEERDQLLLPKLKYVLEFSVYMQSIMVARRYDRLQSRD